MMKETGTFLYWTPRILSILLILFSALMSLDVLTPGLTVRQIMGALLMHNIPVFILLVILVLSWKYEIVGGVAFILAGTLYIAQLLVTALRTGFRWYYVSWAVQISGITFLIGILFLIGWSNKKKNTANHLNVRSAP